VRSYIAIVEASDDGRTWWISFPGFPGVTSAANGPAEIVSQARDALASAVEAGAPLPPSIEEGAVPLDDLGEFHNPMMVLVPYSLPAPASVD
jgi:predicted RNase H-like HicB family nuclease